MTTSRVESSDANNIPIWLLLPCPHHFVVFGMMAMNVLYLFASLQILLTLRLLETVVAFYWISDSKTANYSGNSLKEMEETWEMRLCRFMAELKESAVYQAEHWARNDRARQENSLFGEEVIRLLRQPCFLSCVTQTMENVLESLYLLLNSRLQSSG